MDLFPLLLSSRCFNKKAHSHKKTLSSYFSERHVQHIPVFDLALGQCRVQFQPEQVSAFRNNPNSPRVDSAGDVCNAFVESRSYYYGAVSG